MIELEYDRLNHWRAKFNMNNPKSPVQVTKAEKVVNIPVKMARTKYVCQLEIHRLQLNIIGNEEVLPADVIVLYQPDSRLFSWVFDCYSDEESREKYGEVWQKPLQVRNYYLHDEQIFIYLSDNRMAQFTASWGKLVIRESRQRCRCIEDVYNRIIFIVESNLNEIEQVNYYKWRSIICLDDYLNNSFFYKKGNEFRSTIIVPVTKLNHVSRKNSLWRVELEGYNQQKALLILKNKQENQEEPLLLSDDYYKNRRRIATYRTSYVQEGLPIPEEDYEVLEVWVDGVQYLV